jgi:hypothetical protein
MSFWIIRAGSSPLTTYTVSDNGIERVQLTEPTQPQISAYGCGALSNAAQFNDGN